MTGILAARVVIKTTPGWELWLEGHVGLILAVLTVLILWRIGGSILWHLAVVLGIGVLAEKALNVNQISTITSQVAKGKAVGPTGTSPEILGIVVALFIVSAIFAFRSQVSKVYRKIRKDPKLREALAGGGGGDKEE